MPSMTRVIMESTEANVVYHGSPEHNTVLTPQNKHGDPWINEAIFASPYKEMAAAFLGRWGDRDITQFGEDGKFSLEEMRPGAFDEIYRGKTGYLYTLPADEFRPATTDCDYELVSDKPVRPLSVSRISGALNYIRSTDMILKKYNPNGASYKAAVKRMQERVKQMNDDDREQYLVWVAETNPELRDNIVEGM